MLDQGNESTKSNYIKQLKQHTICIATTGLHGSIGWKLAEYVAFSKAIVTEMLRYKVPGSFDNYKNYLEFTTPEQCVEKVSDLLQNRAARNKMMEHNYSYYNNHLRPDALVLNTINTALSHQ